MKIGPVDFNSGHGTILSRGAYLVDDPFGVVPSVIGFPDDDLVVIQNVLEPPEVEVATRLLRPGATLGGMLSAWNFDPPEDHPDEAEFQYLDAVVYDFRGINDDLDTLEGVRGEHFTRLLTWQPRIDPARTALFALVTPGSNKVEWRERGAAARLAATFDAKGYDAVILAADHESAEEVAILTAFAAEMRAAVKLSLIIATPGRLATVPQPFEMNFTLGKLY